MPIAPLSLYPAVPLPCPRTAAHTEFQKDPPDTFSVGLNEENEDIFCWEVLMYGPEETPFEGGMFKAKLEFPDDFPSMPPKMTFTSEMYHPNIYPDGKVCISILHPPGTDIHNEQESADERWRPIISVEAVLVSVHSMLGDPNLDSPANIDSAVSVHSQCGEQCVLEYSANSAVFTLLSPPLPSSPLRCREPLGACCACRRWYRTMEDSCVRGVVRGLLTVCSGGARAKMLPRLFA